MIQRWISASEFKAKCLALLDEVAGKRETPVVTKRGKPVAKVVPAEEPRSLIGSVTYLVPDDELIREVNRRHGSLPEEILADPELKAIVARGLRADYQIVETYEWRPADPLPVPVTVFVAPGPEVTITTPGLPLTRAYPSAICVAPCSWRTSTCLILESSSAS